MWNKLQLINGLETPQKDRDQGKLSRKSSFQVEMTCKKYKNKAGMKTSTTATHYGMMAASSLASNTMQLLP